MLQLLRHGFKRFTFGGGEPLAVPYVYEVGAMARSRGALSLLRTSAAIPFDRSSLASSFSMMDVSIDSTDPGVLAVCKPGVDPDVLFDNIRLAAGSTNTRCNILLTSRSVESVGQTVRDLSGMGVRSVRLQRLVRRGRAVETYDEFALPEERYLQAVRECVILGESLGMQVAELKSVSRTTLCIVKPDGSAYRGDPTGIQLAGSVREEGTYRALEEAIGRSQEECYGRECAGVSVRL